MININLLPKKNVRLVTLRTATLLTLFAWFGLTVWLAADFVRTYQSLDEMEQEIVELKELRLNLESELLLVRQQEGVRLPWNETELIERLREARFDAAALIHTLNSGLPQASRIITMTYDSVSTVSVAAAFHSFADVSQFFRHIRAIPTVDDARISTAEQSDNRIVAEFQLQLAASKLEADD